MFFESYVAQFLNTKSTFQETHDQSSNMIDKNDVHVETKDIDGNTSFEKLNPNAYDALIVLIFRHLNVFRKLKLSMKFVHFQKMCCHQYPINASYAFGFNFA
jgi:hypothetical protein